MPIEIAQAPLQFPTGVPGLDNVLGGGVPEHSCTVIVGGPGTGKTTLAQQILFANAADGRSGLFFTGPGETPLKLVRHQHQLAFFDREAVRGGIRIVDLSQEIVEGNTTQALEATCSSPRPTTIAQPGTASGFAHRRRCAGR